MNKIIQNINNLFNFQSEKKSMQALIKENDTLQSILNSLGEGVIVSDKVGNFLYFNPIAENILGIGSKNVTTAEWSSGYGTYYPDEVTPYPSEQLPLARAIRGEEVSNEFIYIKNPERSEGVFIEVSASPLRDTKSAVSGGIVIFRDITEIKQAKTAQKQSEERVKALFKGFPIPTYIWQHVNDDFILVDYNNAAEVFTQGNIQNLLGNKSSKIYADSPDIQADFLRCYHDKTTINREMSYRFISNGERKDLIVSYVFVPPDIIMVHTEDITERKKAEVKVRKLSNAVKQTADSVIITNKQGVIEYVNPAFEATTGYSRDEALGQTPKILQSGIHDKAFYKNLWKTIISGKPYRGTIINKKKNGELYWSEQTITPMKDDAGNVTNFVSVLKDITELRKKQEQEFQLNIAREVQQRLYKKANVSVSGFDIAGATYSATETNGDYFDFISFLDGSIGMIVGDVSGHGIGAALVMAQTRAYLRAFAKIESDPGVLLTCVNQELAADLAQENYVTLIIARLDPHKNLLDYANAGHLPTYLLNSCGEVKHIMESTGIPLGIMRDYKFSKSEAMKLAPEDIVFFLTDGITEAQAFDETEFGFDRALDIIKHHRKATAKQIMEHLYQAIRSFSRNLPQEDDITSIICKVNPIS